MKPVVLLDVDGPLGDFHSEARDVANSIFGLSLKVEDFTTWDVTDILPTQEMKDRMNAAIAEPGFAMRIQPQPGSIEAVKTLKSLCEVLFVTTPHAHSLTWMRERQDWLRNHYDVGHEEIIHAFKKHHIIGDVLIDDRPKNIQKWTVHHPDSHAILWDMPYNRTSFGFRHMRTWEEVTALVKSIS